MMSFYRASRKSNINNKNKISFTIFSKTVIYEANLKPGITNTLDLFRDILDKALLEAVVCASFSLGLT